MFYVNSRAIIERNHNQNQEILIQNRVKADEPQSYELPGGRIEPYESLTDALIREVKEETGLTIINIEGTETRIDTEDISPDFVVECIKPFAAYQTIKGPVDSVGFYFRCQAKGELLEAGDQTINPEWVEVDKIQTMLEEDPLQFSDIDRAGLIYYFKEL